MTLSPIIYPHIFVNLLHRDKISVTSRCRRSFPPPSPAKPADGAGENTAAHIPPNHSKGAGSDFDAGVRRLQACGSAEEWLGVGGGPRIGLWPEALGPGEVGQAAGRGGAAQSGGDGSAGLWGEWRWLWRLAAPPPDWGVK